MLKPLWQFLIASLKSLAGSLTILLLLGVVAWYLYPHKTPESVPSSKPNLLYTPLELGLSANQVASLIERAEPHVDDAFGWANDLRASLETHQLPRNRENVCAMIAVIDQESSFQANPSIPGLGKNAIQAISHKLDNIPLIGITLGGSARQWLSKNPSSSRNYLERILQAKTERDLDLLYREVVTNFLDKGNLKVLRNSPLVRDLTEGLNEIDTIGSMQTAVSFAVSEEEKRRKHTLNVEEIWGIRNHLYTRQGGMEYGALLLLGYESGYQQKIHRFADFNAGRYASRNAAFQSIVAELINRSLALDGDLLNYGADGSPSGLVSNSEEAINVTVKQYNLGIDAEQVHQDLLREKQISLTETETYRAIRAQYKQLKGQDAPYAIVPGIQLHSEKTASILTTARFAEMVNKRYQTCMKD
jgi:hypothetical protein